MPGAEPSKYQQPARPNQAAGSDEIFTVRLRYKGPDADSSQELKLPVVDSHQELAAASPDFKFAAAVAAFGMLLRDSQHKGNSTFDMVIELARTGTGHDPHGYRLELRKLAEVARDLPIQQQRAAE